MSEMSEFIHMSILIYTTILVDFGLIAYIVGYHFVGKSKNYYLTIASVLCIIIVNVWAIDAVLQIREVFPFSEVFIADIQKRTSLLALVLFFAHFTLGLFKKASWYQKFGIFIFLPVLVLSFTSGILI